jgi:hypothetical protein
LALAVLVQFAGVFEEDYEMPDIVAGFVKNGVVVPNAPLPEGAFVEVHVIGGPIEIPPELQEEFDAWDRASAQALDLVERLAREGENDAKG